MEGTAQISGAPVWGQVLCGTDPCVRGSGGDRTRPLRVPSLTERRGEGCARDRTPRRRVLPPVVPVEVTTVQSLPMVLT